VRAVHAPGHSCAHDAPPERAAAIRDALVLTVRVTVYATLRSFADSAAGRAHPWNQPVRLTLDDAAVLVYEKLGRWRLYVYPDGGDSLVARLENARGRRLLDVHEAEDGVRVVVHDGSERVEISGEDVKRAYILPSNPFKVAGEPRPVSLNHIASKMMKVYVRRALEAVRGG
jgi:hypothetical protein